MADLWAPKTTQADRKPLVPGYQASRQPARVPLISKKGQQAVEDARGSPSDAQTSGRPGSLSETSM